MNYRIRACLLCLFSVWLALCALPVASAEDTPVVTHDYVGFVYQSRAHREKKVYFYKDVYAYNHREYLLQPFDAAVPERFFVVDGQGRYALAPIVLDVADAVRIALYGGDVGKAALFYGQYTEKVRAANKRWGYSGIHEGLDFIAEPGHPLYALLDGEVLRNGSNKDGAIAIYNEEYNTTIFYLHTSTVKVKVGERVQAGDLIAHEGRRGAGSYYTHIEVRFGHRTSPKPYRNAVLQSDLPYDFFSKALNVTPSGRAPVTAESIFEAEQRRLAEEAEAEAARKAAEEEALRLANPTPAPTPVIELKDEISDGLPDDFGFAAPTNEPDDP